MSRGVGLPPSIEDLHLAAPGAEEVRVEVTACAVCHSDLSYLDGTWATEFPLVLGHEASGRVVELGSTRGGGSNSEADDCGSGTPAGGDIRVGDPVVVTLVRTCGKCRACRRGHDVACTGNLALNHRSPLSDTDGNPVAQGLNVGAFAEQVVVHRSQVVRLPDDVDPLAASLLGCGVLAGAGAVTNTARVAAGDAVVVIGCGGVGTGAIQAARIAGAEPIIAVDPSGDKRSAALDFGATLAVDPVTEDLAGAITTATDGRLADQILVTTGAPSALDGTVDLLAPMGNLVIVGMPGDDVTMEVAPSWLAAANKSILGSKMGTIRVADDVPALVEHHRAGRLDLHGMVSSTHTLDDIAEAFDEVWRGDVLRTVVLPNSGPVPTESDGTTTTPQDTEPC
ncbi:MAG: zinc-binding dehydrogenase [Actinomycetota bacterium]|nr:zinc-binding dehydrogenase [Actinomycetota bacterium]MEC9394559.1 zinc-binding dehydrogenase [Actinomycetota bacterium]MED6328645.1 zinc-binding dehydrogenase [Actinomycetota bacterium]MEE2957565.1 zinc-binding dehydrogenase [Actinomycetota bacterium]